LKTVLRDYGPALQSALERLSLARRFDRHTFAYAVKTFGTALPLDQFNRIASLSFVTEGADGFFSIHSAIADTLVESLTPGTPASSREALWRLFEQRASPLSARDVRDETVAALSEAAFLGLMRGTGGYVEWLNEADTAVKAAARYVPL